MQGPLSLNARAVRAEQQNVTTQVQNGWAETAKAVNQAITAFGAFIDLIKEQLVEVHSAEAQHLLEQIECIESPPVFINFEDAIQATANSAVLTTTSPPIPGGTLG